MAKSQTSFFPVTSLQYSGRSAPRCAGLLSPFREIGTLKWQNIWNSILDNLVCPFVFIVNKTLSLEERDKRSSSTLFNVCMFEDEMALLSVVECCRGAEC